MDWKQIISGVVVGAILGIAGTFFLLGQRLSKLEAQYKQIPHTKIQQLESEIKDKDLIIDDLKKKLIQATSLEATWLDKDKSIQAFSGQVSITLVDISQSDNMQTLESMQANVSLSSL